MTFARADAAPIRLPGAAESELIAGAHRHAVLEDDFHHLLAVNFTTFLVLQSRDYLFRLGVHYFARGGISVTAIEAERYPPRLLAQSDARHLLGWRLRGVENMQPTVCRITDPDFLLIG